MSVEYDYSFRKKDRKRMNAASQRIFDRLVSIDDNFVNLINTAENAVTGVFMITGLIAIFVVVWLGVGWATGVEALSALTERLNSESSRLMASGVITLPLFFFLVWRPLQALSDMILESVGRTIIFTRKFGRSREQKTAVLDAVSNWMRTRPEQAVRIYEQLYGKAPAEIFPAEFRDKLESLTDGKDKPYMIVNRFAEIKPWTEYSKHWFFSPRDEERKVYFLRSRALRNAIKVALSYHCVDTELRDEVPAGDRWVREYKTERNRQITALYDEVDLHHRFRTSAPHYRWPDPGRRKSVGETATVRAITCIENPANLPLFVLPVKSIMNEFPGVIADFYEDAQGDDEDSREIRQERYEAVIAKLAEINVKMFGKYNRKNLLTTSETGIEPQPILRDLALSKSANADIEEVLHDEAHVHDWALRWDPNFIDWAEIQNDAESDTSQSFAVLYEALERAAKNAKPIVLSRGDCLFVDNLRCLIARKEPDPLERKQAIIGFPQDWWLRGYYGFRMSEQTSFDLPGGGVSYSYKDEHGISWPVEPTRADLGLDDLDGLPRDPALSEPDTAIFTDRAVSFTEHDKAPYCKVELTKGETDQSTDTLPQQSSAPFMKRKPRTGKRQPGSLAHYLRD